MNYKELYVNIVFLWYHYNRGLDMKIRYILLIILLLVMVGCNNKLDKEVTLTGKVITREIMVESEAYKVSILNLDEPLVVNGTSVNSVKLNNNEIENNKEVTVRGTLEENNDSIIDLKYELDIKNIE